MADGKSFLPDPPPQIIDVISEAKRLTDRLLDIERYLSTLPWKVEASLWHGDNQALSFERAGKSWVLVWKSRAHEQEAWRATFLKDTSVTIKAKAAEMLPDLLVRIREEYDRRASNLAAGHAALDLLEDALGAGWQQTEGA